MKNARGFAWVVFVASVVLAQPRLANAQSVQGSLEGTVIDPAGAAIAGAAVSARNVDSSATRTAITDDRGSFRLLALTIGTYELVVEHPGFVTLEQKGVVITVGARMSLALRLQPQPDKLSETIVVTGAPPLVEPAKSQVSTTLGQGYFAGLPANGRSFLDFTRQPAGVSNKGPGLSSNGQRGLNLVLMDGADNHNTFYGILAGIAPTPYQFSLDAVQEFQVNVNSYSAELGRAAGGIVNVVTKSGTNTLQSGLFWYFRDDAMNPVGKFGREQLHAQQFGATAGGPIVRSRLFYFVNYEGQRRYEENQTSLNLPNFNFSADPTKAYYQHVALDYLMPRAAPYLRTFDQDIFFVKLDAQLGPGHRLSGRWNRHRFNGGNLEGSGPQNSAEHAGAANMWDDAAEITLTSVLSPAMANTLRFAYFSSDQPGGTNSANPEAQVYEGGQLALTIGRQPYAPRNVSSHRSELADTLSLTRGRHGLQAGVNVLVDRLAFSTAPNFSGSYRFNSLESFGRSLSGVPAPIAGESYIQGFSADRTAGVTVHPNFIEGALFVQDEWRLRSDLTLNLGARYDVAIFAAPDFNNPALAAAGIDTSAIPTDWDNVSPRLGVAWTPHHSDRLVLRAGYGYFYGRTAGGHMAKPFYQNGVTVLTRKFQVGTSSAAWIPAYPNTICGPPDPSGRPSTCPAPIAGNETVLAVSANYEQPLVRQGSAGFDYQVTDDLALSMSYLDARGSHLHRYRDFNLDPNTTTRTIAIAGTAIPLSYQVYSSVRPIPGFDRVLLLDSSGPSSYHALVVQVTKRYSHGSQFMVAYTWSQALEENSTITPIEVPTGDNSLLSDSLNPHLDWGPLPADLRHRLTASGIWTLSYADGLPQVARALLGGWEVAGVLLMQTGFAYSGRINFDLNNDGNVGTDRQPGMPRNAFRMPGIITLDPRITRTFNLTGRTRLQFIVEAFNVFNRDNVTAVNATQYSVNSSANTCGIAGTPCLVRQSNFGTPNDTLGPRVVQIAFRVIF